MENPWIESVPEYDCRGTHRAVLGWGRGGCVRRTWGVPDMKADRAFAGWRSIALAAVVIVLAALGVRLAAPRTDLVAAASEIACASKPGAVLRFETRERRLYSFDSSDGTVSGPSDSVATVSGWVDGVRERARVSLEFDEGAEDSVVEDGVLRSVERWTGGATTYRERQADGAPLDHYYADIAMWPAAIREGSARVDGLETVDGAETVSARVARTEPDSAIVEIVANVRVSDGLPVRLRYERRARYPGMLAARTEYVRETLVRAEYVDVARVPSSAFVLDVPAGSHEEIDRVWDVRSVVPRQRTVFWLGERYEGAKASPFYDCTRPNSVGTVLPDPEEPPLWRFPRFTDRHVVVGYWPGGDDRTWESDPPGALLGAPFVAWRQREPLVRVSSMRLADVAADFTVDPESFRYRGRWRAMLEGSGERVEHQGPNGSYVVLRIGDTVVATMAEELGVAREAADRVRPAGR